MKYTYQARSKEGKIETGTVEASSRQAAAALLQKYDVVVTGLREQSSSLLKADIGLFSRVSRKELAIFSSQLSVMLQSRVPVVQSLKSLALQVKKPSFKRAIGEIAQLVEEGKPLSEAFGTHPEIFDLFYTSLLKTGEASGKISESLSYLAEHLEREHEIVSQIRSALIYPAFVVSVLLMVLLVVMVFVMPRLIDLLRQTTSEPPFFTSLMIGTYGFLSQYGWVVLLGFCLLGGFLAYYAARAGGRKIYDRWILRMPIFGLFLKKIYLIRFAENIATLIAAGLAITLALRITRDTISNQVYKDIVAEVEAGVNQGQKMSFILGRHPAEVPPFVIQMIQVGEETGKLDRNLREIVNFYNRDVNEVLKNFTAILEPVLIIFLGAVVAILALSVIEPLYGALGSI